MQAVEGGAGRSGALGLALCLVVGVAAAILTARTPTPQGIDAPPTAFSAARAMVDDRVIAARPHPEGSPEAKAARDYIFGRMAALGLNPCRLDAEATEVFPKFRGRFAAGGSVQNLIGVLPGTDPSAQAILLMAHSDSVPGSPGAADDGAGVISALEIVRALKAAGPHKRDVIVLITDGEETGLLGARAFFASRDPLLKPVGMIVNMEARGGGGRVAMFETGANNGAAIALFAHAVKNTDALSLMSEVYKYLPNSTDFTVSKRAGYPGYNFAFLGEEFDYHSPSSTPAVLDQGSVQHMGDQALAVTRALVDAEVLPARSPDAIYADLLGGPVIAYPPMMGWVIVALAAVLAVLGAVTGARRDGAALKLGEVARGVAAALCVPLAIALVLHILGRLLDGDIVRDRNLLAQVDLLYAGVSAVAVGVALLIWGMAGRGRGRWLMVALALGGALLDVALRGLDPFGIGLGVITALLALGFGRPLSLWSGWLGVMIVGLLVTLLLQIVSPPLTVAAAWPVLIGAAGLAVAGVLGRGAAGGIAALTFGVLAALEVGHLTTPIFTAVGPDAPEVMALIPFLAAFALFPLILGWSGAKWGPVAAGVLAASGLLGLGVAGLRDPASARTPSPVQAFYLDDAAAGRTWRASTLDRLDPWSRAALTQGGGPLQQAEMAPVFGKVWRSPAPAVTLARPDFNAASTETPDGRTVRLIISPKAGGRELRLYLQPTVALTDVTLNGHPTELAPRPGAWVQLRWTAATGPLTLTFKAKAPGALDLRYQEITDAWPKGLSAPPKPATVMPWGLSDRTVLLDRYQARW